MSARDRRLMQEYIMERTLLKRQAQRGDLLAMTQFTNRDYEAFWSHDVIAQTINLWIEGKIRFLMIFAPPQHGKSELVSRRLPAHLHGLFPDERILTCSYNAQLASEMTDSVQKIMDSKEFKELYPMVRISPLNSSTGYERNSSGHQLVPVQDPATKLWYVPKGSLASAGVGGSFIGRPADKIIVDDPIKSREEADSPVYRDKLWKFFQTGLRSRINKNGQILLMHQRWHEDDLAGRLLELARKDPLADQWHVLSMPAIREKLEDERPYDPRGVGEVLWPEKFPLTEILSHKAAGLRDFSAMYQQTPTAEGGNIIKASDIKYYFSLPPQMEKVIDVWDFAVKAKQANDPTAGAKWGALGPDRYLIYQINGRFPFPIQLKKVRELNAIAPYASRKYFEAKANGPAAEETLKKEIAGIQEWEPLGDKLARLNAVAPQFEGGNVWFPHPSIAPWVDEVVHQLTSFPAVAHDDICDTTSMALLILQSSGPVYAPSSGHSTYRG